MTSEQPAVAAVDGVRPRRSTERAVACAIDLGWRVAALYATSLREAGDDTHLDSDLLPNRARLLARDRVELELRAIAGDVARAGVELSEQDLARLLELGREAADSAEAEARFREELARRHVAFEIALWAQHEARGKAYEIGNFVSDTWNRVVRPRPSTSSESELLEVFSAHRVTRMKVLLDDLQTRIDPAAVHTVQTHLDSWRDRVHDNAGSSSRPSAEELTHEEIRAKYEPVERQTVIWRQLLTGDKEREAFID